MKIFTTYDEQISILKSRHLIIEDENMLMQQLEDIGYYNLINGYSFIFKDKDDNYIQNASSNDIISLYNFDKSLRTIVYKYALKVESKFKSLISYIFSNHHGVDEKLYLLRENFDKDIEKESNIIRLINNLNELITESKDKNSSKWKRYISHYAENHGHVPFWVLVRAMTFGDISIFYANMILSEKTEIANKFNLSPSQLESMLKSLVQFRNTVAHDERIFCKKINRNYLTTKLPVYDLMRIPRSQTGTPYSGINDFLSLMIIFKYLLSPLDFADFWLEFTTERDILIKNIKSHFVSTINNEMGLKNRWKNLQNYKPQ